MKREILFKGKSVNTGEWFESMTIANGTIKRKRDDVFMEIGENKWIGIHPNSLSQFTGLKIGNTKLFEGDIFNYTKHKGYLCDDFQGEIKFEDGCFGFVVITGQVYRTFTAFSEIDELQSDFLNHIDIVGHTFDSGS